MSALLRRACWLAALALGCAGERRVPAQPPALALESPALAMPADLDLVLRLDLDRLRASLGPGVRAAFERLLAQPKSGEPDAETGRLVLELLGRARTAWIGVRPGLPAELTDNVIVLRGDFAELVPSDLGGAPRFGPARDLGGAVRRFERPRPEARAAPAVIYALGSELVVFGSFAEIDALERTLERRRGDPPLEAPDFGVVSLAARFAGLRRRIAERAPTLGRLLAPADRVEASAELRGGDLELELNLRIDSAEAVANVADGLRALAAALANDQRPWLAGARVEPAGSFVSVRVRVPERDLLAAARCWATPDCGSDATVGAP